MTDADWEFCSYSSWWPQGGAVTRLSCQSLHLSLLHLLFDRSQSLHRDVSLCFTLKNKSVLCFTSSASMFWGFSAEITTNSVTRGRQCAFQWQTILLSFLSTVFFSDEIKTTTRFMIIKTEEIYWHFHQVMKYFYRSKKKVLSVFYLTEVSRGFFSVFVINEFYLSSCLHQWKTRQKWCETPPEAFNFVKITANGAATVSHTPKHITLWDVWGLFEQMFPQMFLRL